MTKKIIFPSAAAILMALMSSCASSQNRIPSKTIHESIGHAISQAQQVKNEIAVLENKKSEMQKFSLRVPLICLEIGRLDFYVVELLKQVSYPNETYEDQRKDLKRDPILSAYERVSALTGLCGELSGESVAGFRYMPKLKMHSSELKRGLELLDGLISDLQKFKN